MCVWVRICSYRYGATLITNGEINFKDLMTAMMALMLSAIGLGNALLGLGDQKEGLLAAKRIFNSIDDGVSSPIDGLSQEGNKPPHRAQGTIELRNVSFRYPSRPDVEVCKVRVCFEHPTTTFRFVGFQVLLTCIAPTPNALNLSRWLAGLHVDDRGRHHGGLGRSVGLGQVHDHEPVAAELRPVGRPGARPI